MKITSVTLDGVGRFGTRTEIAGLGGGVNILAAGNEAGKSTMFRAVRACLFERHNTKNEFVRNLATDGASLPVTVTLGFEHGDRAYTVTKSFVKSPAASLMRDGTEIARGREADEMVWELLGIAPGSGRSVDEAAFGLLWVGQGQSIQVPLPSEAATTALNAAVQAEVGTLVGGERARSVLSVLRAELAQLVTDTGRPKAGGPFAGATARLDVSESDLADAERRLSILDTQLVDLATKQCERSRLGDPALLAETMGDLATAQQDLKAGEAAATLLSQFEAAEQRSRANLDRAERQLSDLEERRARIDGDRERSAQIREALHPIGEQEKAARGVVRRARDEIADVNAQAEKGDEQERGLQCLATAVARATARPSLISRQQALEELERRIIKNEAGLSGNCATAAALRSLDETERELSVLIARLEASAPEISVELGTAGAGQVSIGTTLLTDSFVRPVLDPLTIQIGDLAIVTVSPPAAANAADQKKRLQLQTRLHKVLEDAGAATAAELRAARARRQGLEAEAAGLEAEIGALGIRGTSPTLAIERIKSEIGEIDALVAEALTQAKLDVLPTAEEVALRQDGLRQKREEGRRKRQALDGTIEAQNAILSDLADTRGRLSGTLMEIQNRLDGDLAILPDADRSPLTADAETAVADTRDDHRVKAVALEEQRLKAPPQEQLERFRIRIDRLQQALDGQRSRLGSLDRDIANLEGQIQNAGGDGLGEKVVSLHEERELADREVEKYKSRAATMTLLKETIEACYKEQRDRLHAPLRRHLQPFLNDVFPSAEIELGDGFSIAGIKRNGPAPETFAHLSTGTQEQIAVLVRLAMGAMICERGQAVPIILDDALVFSDDDRIGQMFDALNRAGQKQQVIVLTCRTRAFAALGGRQLSISSAVCKPVFG
jgi:DNA repair exonuclease SbcCD ATPase subunit